MADEAPEPLRNLVSLWLEKIKRARDYKWKVFGKHAAEGMSFYNGPHDFMYEGGFMSGSRGLSYTGEGDVPYPGFRMTVNKVAEMVQLFGPVLYARNPYRLVRPRHTWVPHPALVVGPPPTGPLQPGQQEQTLLAMEKYNQLLAGMELRRLTDESRGQLLESYLNYTPNETGLKDAVGLAIDEALIKGMGVLWTELWTPPGGSFRIASSYYDTVDNLLLDPDMETVQDAQWCARRCCHPVWEVEEEYGLAPGSLKANLGESVARQVQVDTEQYGAGPYDRKRGMTNDLLEYWKVFSKMGLGAKLQNADPELRKTLDGFGNYAYLVVANGITYPLNLPPASAERVQAGRDEAAAQELLTKLDWPTPWWMDKEWPFSDLAFHRVPRCAWPMSHLTPALGEQKFLNWAYSFLVAKVRNTCRDFIAVLKSAGEEMKTAILKGSDLTLLEIESQHKTITEVVQFLQHPAMSGDIFKVIQAVELNFEKRTGLSEMMYGQTTTQSRSAEETATKRAFLQVRPDDMAEKVEQFSTRLARKEAILARWHLGAEDVAPVLGPVAAHFWGQLVQSADFQQIVRELDYRVEAGSTRKPNKEATLANMDQGAQVILPVLDRYAFATSDFSPLNAFVQEWAKARDLDASALVLQPPPPPPAAPPGGPEGAPPAAP